MNKINQRIPSVISFFGPEGCGKTTHATLLLSALQKRGYRTRYCTIRDRHLFAYVLFRFLLVCGAYEYVSYPFGFKLKIPKACVIKKIVNLWLYLEFVSLVLVNSKIILYKRMGYRVVMERYLYDSITTVSYWINAFFGLGDKPSKKWRRLANVLCQLVPRDAVVIYLDVNYLEAQARYRKRVGMTAREDLFLYYRKIGHILFASNSFPFTYANTTTQSVTMVQEKICLFLGLSKSQ